MSKVLFVGDPHIKISRFDLGMQFLTWLDDVIEQEKPALVVYLGDAFDTHAILRSEILSEFKKHLVKNQGVYKIYLLGNHDGWKPNDMKYHALETLKELDNFTVVDKVTTIDDITYVPYTHIYSNFPLDTASICVAHQTFIGADYGYHRPEAGVDADKVSAEVIISGHVHKRQSFGKVIYPGTPFAQSVNDIDQDKGVMVFNTSTYKYRFIESPLPRWRGLKYVIGQDYTIDQLHEDLQIDIDDKNHWVIDITGPKVDIATYLDSKKYAKFKKGKSIRARTNYTDSQKKRVKIKATTVDSIIKEYIDKVYDGPVDKKIVTDKALKIRDKILQNKTK